MARIDDGLLYLEIDGASQEQLQKGLAAARLHIVRAGLFVDEAMQSAERRDRYEQANLGSQADDVSPPEEPDETDLDRADVVDEAWLVALEAAGFGTGTLGLLPPGERPTAAVRDLFEEVG